MEYWQTLVKTALMGTHRQAPPPPKADPDNALTTLLGQLDWSQPEKAVLAVAGAVALHQQVGQQPVKKTLPSVEPAPLEDLPVVGALTDRALRIAMDEHPKVMPELLKLIAAVGQRVPDQWLPKLLNLGSKQAQLRPQIIAVIGHRGRWLAAQNPAWRYGIAPTLADFLPDSPAFQTLWEQGSRGQRVLFLQQWRDVDPSAAREALAAVWAAAQVKEREALLEVLATHLSPADEPFLEEALGDRGQLVRELAVDLLVQLPESGLSQRMAQRVQAFVQIQAQGQTVQINVTLPETCEPAWQRDGINPKATKGQGKRAHWLLQMVASTPLSVWAADPTAIAQALAGHEWQGLLIKGWGLAAQQQNDGDWAYALIDQFGWQSFDEDLLTALLALLSLEQREQLLEKHMPRNSTHEEPLAHWLHLVAQSSQGWSLNFSRLVFKQLINILRSNPKHSYPLLYPVRNIALTLHPALVPDVAEAIAQLSQTSVTMAWQAPLHEFLNRLNFRQEIHQAFQGCD